MRRHCFKTIGWLGVLAWAFADAAPAQGARAIPLRIVYAVEDAICTPDSAPALDYFGAVETSVQRANQNFAAAGIKFWVKSMEFIPTRKLGHLEGPTSWSAIREDARALFPTARIPLDAYEDNKVLSHARWVDALTAAYGETDMAFIFVKPRSGLGFATHPVRGRTVHVHNCNLREDANACSGAATSHLAHELGHYFGAQHPDYLDKDLNPVSKKPWTPADQWDEIFCTDNGYATFFGSKSEVPPTCSSGFRPIAKLYDEANPPDAWCVTVPKETGITVCTSPPWFYYTSGSPEISGLTRDLGGAHNPPARYRYANNVMIFFSPLRAAYAVSTFFSDSTLAKIKAYASNETAINSEFITAYRRNDGTLPTGARPDAQDANLVDLGTDNRDFIYWANSFSFCGETSDFTFRTTYRDISGSGYRPVSGDFDNDGYDDILWYSPNDTTARFWWGNASGTFAPENRSGFFSATGYSHVFAGDFDGDNRDDIFAYAGGNAFDDYIYWSGGGRTFFAAVRNVSGYYTPLVGDFNGTNRSDIFWYHARGSLIHTWWATGHRYSPFFALNDVPTDPGGPFTPIVGDYDNNGFDDIFWYTSVAQDRIWYLEPGFYVPTVHKLPARNVVGTYAPLSGDFNGDGHSDIFWDAQGKTTDSLWPGASMTDQFLPSLPASVYGTFVPVAGDFNGDGRTDVFWYRGPH